MWRVSRKVSPHDGHEERHRDGEDVLVEGELRIVVGGSKTLCCVSRPDEDKHSGHLLEVVGEVLSTHADLRLDDVAFADELLEDGAQERDGFAAVDDRRIPEFVVDCGSRAKSFGRMADDAAQTGGAKLGVFPRQCAQGAGHVDALGNDVECRAAVDGADGYHTRFERIGLARDDSLEGGDNLGRGYDWVRAEVWRRGVCALAGDRQLEPVGFRQERPCTQTDLAKLERIPQMHPEDKGDIRVLEDPLLDAWFRAAGRDLFCWLKEQLDRSAKLVPMVDEPVRDGEQRPGMAVMAAGMHHTLVL